MTRRAPRSPFMGGAKPHRGLRTNSRDMEPIIAGRDLRKSWGATLVLEHADFLLHAGDKVALVGPNGSGKSTLFRLLAGETAPDLGDLVLKPGLRYGYLPQVPNVPPETVVRDVLSAPSPEAQRIEAELAGMEAWMARPDAWDAKDASARMARYESLHVARGSARSESVIVNDPILNDLGVGEELLDQRFGSLSGGEKSKVLTARALANAKEKDVLLLDEPTNHMDVDTIETIEGFLLEIDAAVLLASHDKFLLDAIAEKVIELDRFRTLEYVGNYTDYRVQRDAIARAREAQAHRHQKELKRQLAIIEEFKSRKVYEQVLSRKLRIERMRRETPEAPPTAPRAFRLSFRKGASGPGVVRLEGVAKSHRVRQLSGGERARLALAKFIAQDYDLLVLDEPTNHLDIESQEIVAAALQTYPGMLLVVSHNRSFLNEVANKIAVIAHQRLAVFQGTFKDSWAAAKMAEFMAVKQKPRYRVLRMVKDWETGTSYHGGDVIALQGAETQAFLRLLRWSEANGRVERIET